MSLITNSPGVKPLHVAILLVGSNHSPADRHKVDIKPNGESVQNAIDGVLQSLDLVSQHPIGAEAESKDGKVESRIVVMYIGDTSHCNEW